jgi:enterochelin esterase family protein
LSDRIDSPRLQTLDPDRTGEFWADIAVQGTPLVEPVPGDDQRVLLTFLYRETEPVGKVAVSGGHSGGLGSGDCELVRRPAQPGNLRLSR